MVASPLRRAPGAAAGHAWQGWLATQDEPVLARYNARLTPCFLRRNEIWWALR